MDNDRQKESNLLAKIANKDVKAFEALYKLLSQAVFNYLFRLLKNRESAEDLLVEVFTVVWKSAVNFKGNSRVKTWIFGIARNLAFNEIRKKRPVSYDFIDDTLKDENSSKKVKNFENSEYVQKAILKLSEKHREILDLVFFQEFKYRQIAKLLAIPENTVKTRVYHAKTALKQQLIEMEG
jgi:RNA polymerase sigma-70 factor, ECF subfamily